MQCLAEQAAWARTLQGYDIAALQYLYGASTTVQADSYSFDAGGTLSATLWNPNAGSAIDLSNQSGTNFVDLRAGKRSSINIVDPYSDMPFTKAQYATLKSGGKLLSSIIGKPTYTGKDNLLIAPGSQSSVATGGSGADTLVGNTIGGTLDGGNLVEGGDGNVIVLPPVPEERMPVLLSAYLDDPDTLATATLMAQLAMPYLVCMTLASLLSGVLNTMGRFALTAGAPILLNVCTIVPLFLVKDAHLAAEQGAGAEPARV